MKFKKVLLPLIAGALAISLAACSGEDKAKKDETSKEQDKVSTEELQKKLEKQQVDEQKIVAIVNEEELKGEHFNAALTSIQGQMQQLGQDPSSKEIAEQVKELALNTIVNQTLFLQQAEAAEIKASDAEIDEEYAALEKRFGDVITMKEALESQNLDVATVRESLAETIIFKKYQNKIAPIKEVTDKEIQDYYDQIAEQAKENDQEEDLPTLEEASGEIKEMLEQEQQKKKLAEHVEELKKDAKIEMKI